MNYKNEIEIADVFLEKSKRLSEEVSKIIIGQEEAVRL